MTRLSGTPLFAKSRLKKLIKAASGGLFYARQRVTTEGKAMRKVRCVKDRYIWEGSDRKKVTDTFEGVFHGWGCDYEEFENGPGNYSVGIVELGDGSVQRFIPENIKFIE
ncbi:hypothetical protein RS421_001948 [Enterobacter kobei]|nr:hypothetical protein [Enterobacter kobei]